MSSPVQQYERCRDMLDDVPGEDLEAKLTHYIGSYMGLQTQVQELSSDAELHDQHLNQLHVSLATAHREIERLAGLVEGVAAEFTKAQLEDLRSHIRGAQPSPTGTYDYELGSGWRCFHCGEMFRTWGGASLHFGGPADKRPACIAHPSTVLQQEDKS